MLAPQQSLTQSVKKPVAGPITASLFILSTQPFNSSIATLENQLRKQGFHYQTFQDYSSLFTAAKSISETNLHVIIENIEDLQAEKLYLQFVKQPFFTNLQISSYPKYIKNTKCSYFDSPLKIINFLRKPKNQENKKIILKKVESISKIGCGLNLAKQERNQKKYSKDQNQQSVQENKDKIVAYEKLLFEIGSEKQQSQEWKELYISLTNQLKQMEFATPFTSLAEIKHLASPEKNHRSLKYLIVSNASHCIELAHEVNSAPALQKTFDFVMVGRLIANKEMLNQNVILATSSPQEAIHFIQSHYFSAYQQNHLPNDEQLSKPNQLNQPISQPPDQLIGSKPKKIKKIKTPVKEDQKDFPLISLVNGGKKDSKKQKDHKQINNEQQVSSKLEVNQNWTDREMGKDQGKRQFYGSEINNGEDKKFKQLNVIQQMSDQYRGSNRESFIVNIDSQNSFKNHSKYYQPLPPDTSYQENHKTQVISFPIQRPQTYSFQQHSSPTSIHHSVTFLNEKFPAYRPTHQQRSQNYLPSQKLANQFSNDLRLKESSAMKQEFETASKTKKEETGDYYQPAVQYFNRENSYSSVKHLANNISTSNIDGVPITKTIVQNNHNINLSQYIRVEENGIIYYKKKSHQKEQSQLAHPITTATKVPASNQVLQHQRQNQLNGHTWKLPQKTSYYQEYLSQMEKNKQSFALSLTAEQRERRENSMEKRINVQRIQRPQPLVEAVDMGKKGIASQFNWNESFGSKLSELHSDGSILKRNNIRFGVNLYSKRKERDSIASLDSKLSGLWNVNELNKKMALNKAIVGSIFIEEEKERHDHVQTNQNLFHFLVQEQLPHIEAYIKDRIGTGNDAIEQFGGYEDLFEKIRLERVDAKYDAGFIFLKKGKSHGLNHKLLPNNYYVVSLLHQTESSFRIDHLSSQIQLTNLDQISLAQKIIIHSNLYSFILRASDLACVQKVWGTFENTEYLLEIIQSEVTAEVLDYYFVDEPRLTRVYLLCSHWELETILKALKIYQQLNPLFKKDWCYVICVLEDLLEHFELMERYANEVTFISSAETIQSHFQVMKYVHFHKSKQNKSSSREILILPAGAQFQSFNIKIDSEFPGRFEFVVYEHVQDVQARILKFGKCDDCIYYLVLDEEVTTQISNFQPFEKVFMMGKHKIINNRMRRVFNVEQLIEIIKK